MSLHSRNFLNRYQEENEINFRILLQYFFPIPFCDSENAIIDFMPADAQNFADKIVIFFKQQLLSKTSNKCLKFVIYYLW